MNSTGPIIRCACERARLQRQRFRPRPCRHQSGRTRRCAQARAAMAVAVKVKHHCSRVEQVALTGSGLLRRRRGFDGLGAGADIETSSACARTRPSVNSTSIHRPALIAAAARNGRPLRSRTSAKPRASTPRWDRADSNPPQRSIARSCCHSKASIARRARSTSTSVRSRSRWIRAWWACAFARVLPATVALIPASMLQPALPRHCFGTAHPIRKRRDTLAA